MKDVIPDWTLGKETSAESFHLCFRGKPIIQGFRDSTTQQIVVVLCDKDNDAHGGYFFVPYPKGDEPDPEEHSPEELLRKVWIPFRLVGPPGTQPKTLREVLPKSKCTHCGKVRVIEYVCLSGMDDADERIRTKKIELCKRCTTSKNKCRHSLCRDNYRDRLEC